MCVCVCVCVSVCECECECECECDSVVRNDSSVHYIVSFSQHLTWLLIRMVLWLKSLDARSLTTQLN